MCRFLAFQGEPILMETLVAVPSHSLIYQSLHAAEARTETNGDGFGLGWYGEREKPGLYRDIRPAWSDDNLRSIAGQVRSRLFFAHVRSTTGTSTMRVNCHPFVRGRYMFMHNGQIGGWAAVRRRIEAMIPDEHYVARAGTTDSEAIFLAALGRGLEHDPIAAVVATLRDVKANMRAAGVDEPLRFTAALADGNTLWAFRWACDDKPPSLYYKEGATGLLLVSEPIDGERDGWNEVSRGGTLIATTGQKLRLERLDADMVLAA